MTKLRASRLRTRAALLVAGTTAALLAMGAPAMASTGEPFIWNGNGISSISAERAIDEAIEDVEIMAAGEGFFECELYDEPQVWEVFDDPNPGSHYWRASVNMTCE